ncbi:TPA: methyltransferase domain-containing protein [Legionella pneumophila subsp. pneumophila]|nr:class I SAM-dependent methyltransferase [Legionella taurinensis]HAT8890278.1 methyltransferase domain-containing protein [Legionella pneumophila subsp. pneumophila]
MQEISIVSKKTTNFGLPIEYQQLPLFFDAHNINDETEVKNALIEKLLKMQGSKTILDMTCGTGSQVLYLAQHGYKITGSDLSPALIDSARNKAKKMNLSIPFIVGDMRTINVGKFDAVITIFSAIGHLNKSDFEIMLQNIRHNLNDGGIYIFDIFNLQALTDEVIKNFVMDINSVVDGVTFRNQQNSEIDRENGLLISHDKYTITKEGSKEEYHTNTFSLQIYTAQELQNLLEKNGFEVLNQYDMDGHKFIPDKSLNILTVAKMK